MKPRHTLSLRFALGSAGLFAQVAPESPASPSPAVVAKGEAQAVGSWRAAAAEVKITPEKPMWMTGSPDRSTGTELDLWAKALAIEDPAGRQAVMITLDLCGVHRDFSDRIATELEERHHIPRRSVILNVSHTHTGPVVEGFQVALHEFSAGDWDDIVAYRQELELRIIRAAEDALDRLAPATLSWGVDSADFAVNRRNNVEKKVPELRAAGKLRGPVDDDVPVLAVRSRDGDLIAVMVSYSCHNTTRIGASQWSSDYAGYAQAEIQRRHPGAIALFVQGCGGDVNALPRGRPQAEDYGRRLADAADRQLAQAMHPVRGEFNSSLEDISLPFAHQPTPDELKVASESKAASDRAWARYLEAQLKEAKGKIRMTHDYPVQAWRLGDLSFIALGDEVVVEYELRMQRECRSPVWVFGYSNDVMAYIPTESILAEDTAGARVAGTHMGYEGKASARLYALPSPWAPGLEDKIVAAAHRELERAQMFPPP